MNIQHTFQQAIFENNVNLIKTLLKKHEKDIDFSYLRNHAIKLVSACGYFDIFNILIQDKTVDPTVSSQFSIRSAFKYSHYKIADKLLENKNVNPTILNNICLHYTIDNNNIEMAKLLLRKRKISTHKGYLEAMKKAYVNGYTEMFELLFSNLEKSFDYDVSDLFNLAKEKEDFYLIKKILSCRSVKISNNKKYSCCILKI